MEGPCNALSAQHKKQHWIRVFYLCYEHRIQQKCRDGINHFLLNVGTASLTVDQHEVRTRKYLIVPSSTFTIQIPDLLVAPIKWLPQSEQVSETLPLIAIKRLKALVKADAPMSSTTSM